MHYQHHRDKLLPHNNIGQHAPFPVNKNGPLKVKKHAATTHKMANTPMTMYCCDKGKRESVDLIMAPTRRMVRQLNTNPYTKCPNLLLFFSRPLEEIAINTTTALAKRHVRGPAASRTLEVSTPIAMVAKMARPQAPKNPE